MCNSTRVLTLILLVPLGLVLTTNRPKKVALTSRETAPCETSSCEQSPSVQVVATPSIFEYEPLISPIVGVDLVDVRPVATPFDFTHGVRAIFHPHGEQICASGCAASRHPTEILTQARFDAILLEFANEPIGNAGPAQDTLLYFGRQTTQWLTMAGPQRLDPIRAAILKHELGRDHARIEIRVVDAMDRIRAALPATSVPLDRRHEFDLDTHDLQPMIASGTVKRVGRDYLWTRL